jgi:hypothetical protein
MSAAGGLVAGVIGVLTIVLGFFTLVFPVYVVYEVVRAKVLSDDEDSEIRYKRITVLAGLMFSGWIIMIMGGAIFATVQKSPETQAEPVKAFNQTGVHYEPPEGFERQQINKGVNFYNNTSGVNLVVKRTTVNKSIYDRYRVLTYLKNVDEVYSASNETLVEVDNRTFHKLSTVSYRGGYDAYTITYATHIGDGQQFLFQAYSINRYPTNFALEELGRVQIPS